MFASFGVGIGQIWLDEVACTGNESRLIDCPANPLGLHNCVHDEDAGVRCLHQVAISKLVYMHLFCISYIILIMHDIVHLAGLAMDWISNKLYYVERRVWDQYNTVGVFDITISQYKVLPMNVDAPHDITVDPTTRLTNHS